MFPRARAGFSILRMHMKARMQFRGAYWAHVLTMSFAGFVYSLIVLVFYKYGMRSSAGAESGLTPSQAVSYVWLVHICVHLLPGMGLDADAREKIRSGDVGLELCRPLDLYAYWFVRGIAQRVGPFVLHMLPIMLIAFLMPHPFRLQPPASLMGLLACVVSLMLGVFLSCAIMGLTYVVLMKVSWGDGPIYAMAAVTDLLSGANLPLQLWPASLQRLLFFQPFAGIMDIPFRLYLGVLPPTKVLHVAIVQLAWGMLFISLGWWLMQKRLRSLVIQGG